MVFNAVRDYFAGPPVLPPGKIKLPKHFPLVPVGCEKHSDLLFTCIGSKATERLRDMEKDDPDKVTNYMKDGTDIAPDDDPLEPCRQLVANYNRCLERNIYRRNNERLLESYRVHEEYRYQKK